MSSYECGVCGWAGRMPWGRECPQCHPKTDQQITFQVLAGRRDEEAIAAAKRYVRGLEAQVQRVRAVADAWEYYASENGNVRTAWAASSVREALDGAALSQRLWKAEQTLEQVRRLHRNHDDDCPLIPLCARQGRCDECGQDWPCATIRILDGGDE